MKQIPESDYRATADPKGWADAFMEDVGQDEVKVTFALVEGWFRKAILSGYATGFIDGETKANSKNIEKFKPKEGDDDANNI